MPSAKITVTLDSEMLAKLDQLVAERRFASRSCAVQQALREKLPDIDISRLTRECKKLDPRFERQLAEGN